MTIPQGHRHVSADGGSPDQVFELSHESVTLRRPGTALGLERRSKTNVCYGPEKFCR